VILAGGRNKPDFVRESGIEFRSLTPYQGRPMVDHVITALHQTDSIAEIIVVGAGPPTGNFQGVPDHGGFVENTYAGLEAAGGETVLISTSDIPLITAESVEDFLRLALQADADIVYPIVHVEDCYRRFPGVKRTSAPLKDGDFTGGNMMLVRRRFMESQKDRLSRAYALRKSPLKLAMMIGMGTTVKLTLSILLRRRLLTLNELESAISRVLGGKVRAVVSRYPEIAADIDQPSDLAAIEGAKTPRAS
jgi:GTP:adenosylcobinamide-phosphate guanylyltransferase